MISPKNRFKFYYKNSNAQATSSTISIEMVIDQIERRIFANYSGGNSLFGSIYGASSHKNKIKDKLTSCEIFQDILSNEIDVTNFNECHNCNF